MSIHIYFKYNNIHVTGADPPSPQRPYDVSCGQNRYVTLPQTTNIIISPRHLKLTHRLKYFENWASQPIYVSFVVVYDNERR